MPLIQLRHYHRKSNRFEHPLLDGAKPVTDVELAYLHSTKSVEEVLLALRSCLRHLVGRFIANWPASEPYVDDMVSEGLVAFTRLIREGVESETLMFKASQRAQEAIEVYLNKAVAMTAPSLTTQKRLLRARKDVNYPTHNTDLSTVEKVAVDETFNDEIFDAISLIEARDDLDAALLSTVYTTTV